MAHFAGRLPVLALLCMCLPLFAAFSAQAQDAEIKPEQLYKQSLPSVMTLKVELMTGGAATGTAFLALKEGMAVTCWHVIEGAKRVTARFSDGEEFDVTGLVDRDEKRDLALVRVKVAGRPLLSLATTDPPVGSRAYAIGAPRGFEFSISDGLVSQVRTEKGRKEVQISCPVSPGNSGGPVLGSNGKVIGIVSYGRTDGQNLNFAISSVYAAGFDTSLSTQTWDTVKATPKDKGETDGPPPAVVEAAVLDPILAEGLLDYRDAQTAFQYINTMVVIKRNAYRQGVPTFAYTFKRETQATAEKLERMKSADPVREELRVALIAGLRALNEALDLQAQGVNRAQAALGWIGSASDLIVRASAASHVKDEPTEEMILKLFEHSATFKKAADANGHALFADDTGFSMGVTFWRRRSLTVVFIVKDSLADQMGLEPLDTIVSLDGERPAHLLDFKRRLREKAGHKVSISVTRQGKMVTLDAKLPKQLPAVKTP